MDLLLSEYEQKSNELLKQVATAANEAADANDAIQLCLSYICNFMEWPVGHALVVDHPTQTIQSSQMWFVENFPEISALREISEKEKFSSGYGLPGAVLLHKQPVWVEDISILSISGNSPRAELCKKIGLKAAFAFPIIVRDHVTTILEFFDTQARVEDSIISDIVLNVGQQLSKVLERQSIEEKLQKDRATLEKEVELKTQSLIKAKIKAEGANRAKDEFLANISHELRTPLHSILSYSQLGVKKIDSAPKEQMLKYYKSINSSAQRLLHLVDNLLDLSKLNSGVAALQYEKVNLQDLLYKISDELMPFVYQ